MCYSWITKNDSNESFLFSKWGVIRESNSCILVPQTSVLTTSPMAPFQSNKYILPVKTLFDNPKIVFFINIYKQKKVDKQLFMMYDDGKSSEYA